MTEVVEVVSSLLLYGGLFGAMAAGRIVKKAGSLVENEDRPAEEIMSTVSISS